MQGNKKGADGFSDTSSIGSVLDDADREVSSLTDRAFRSLCISEDTSFSDSDLALTPDPARQVLGSLHQGTVSHARRKSGIWSQLPSQGTEHAGWAATFQQLPKYVQGEEEYPKGSPPLTPAQRRLEVPISGLRSSSKPISKVSSLIKSFDRPESQQCDSRPPTSKPPAIKTTPKFAPLPESGVNFCFDSAFLTVRRVPAEVSGPQPGRKHTEQEPPRSPEGACQGSGGLLPAPESGASSSEPPFSSPPHRPALGEPGRSQEWARRGTFLHSENSAFESWSSRQPRLPERREPAEAGPEGRPPKHGEDLPSVREPQAPASRASPCRPRASCGHEESRPAAGTLSASGPWRCRDPGAPAFPTEDRASSAQPDLPARPSQAPWRKAKTRKGGTESTQEASEEKQARRPGLALHNSQGQFPENDALGSVDPSDGYPPPFNISKLLTPIIPTKHVLDPSFSPPAEGTPSPPGQLNGYQEEPSEPRDSYRARAPSLLFNLKDVRRCVKSTYSPSPLLKGSDEKGRGSQEPLSNGMALPNGLEESPPRELCKERPADTPLPQVRAQSDPKADPGAASADSHPAPSSPPSAATAPFCANGEADEDATHGDPDVGAPDPRESCPRRHLSLKLCSGEPEAGRAAQHLRALGPESRFSRSVSQETEAEREAGLRNPSLSQKVSPKVSPGPLSPEEEDVFYSDSQSDFVPALKGKAKFSTSSSDQSFASFEDQQKMGLPESPREDGRNGGSAGEREQNGLEEPHRAAGDGCLCAEEQSGQGAWRAAGGGVCGERPRKASREEADLRGAWVGGSRDTGLSPSSTPNRHRLFAIKDNTLRATPVIRPVMLPLLRALSSEDPLGSGHREEEVPRPGWGEDAGLGAPKSQEVPSTPTPTSLRGPPLKHVAHRGTEDQGWASGVARREAQGSVSSTPLPGEGEGRKPPPDAGWKAVADGGRSYSSDLGEPEAPRRIPTIALPESDSQGQPPPQQPGTSWEEQTQDFQSHFLSTPRVGPPGRRLAAGEPPASPNSSSLEGSGAHSPAASSLWDDAAQGPWEPGLMPGEPSRPGPWATPSPGPTRAARREDLTHAFTWEAGADPQLEPSTEDLRALSPGGSLLDVAAGLAIPDRAQPSAQLERAAAKPPAVPPKTEKALRRAKKLASKRRKADPAQDLPGGAREEDAAPGPLSPGERLLPRFPAVRALPPPTHRHSVAAFSEPDPRRPGGPQSLRPLPPYPATQKVLQDPQSGEYFVFDLPLQVKMKTFYDPETGRYVKVPIPASEEGFPEPLPLDAFAAPFVLCPGIRPLRATALMPLRCSSQLSAPTFLGQSPGAWEAARPAPPSTYPADPQPAPQPPGNPAQRTAGASSRAPPGAPAEGTVDAPSLGIISTNDLEDFASEGIS
ncbi:cardiac-enriched FHL2-interacting protein [Pipistrellus kuhlii]|uniref:DUF4585 domain-containing protein n=1 Tax=Pipistrellus kuhlii TaxID=59472 RepID=A0A7J7T180_PIPKU|nr:cardiac-enriched FHL2-interacting protein [Pipistrellus kuhlii]KAF6294107.1 hypothetical protein mPipKuh1_001625 [Pipistrellus kuhlii]